MHLAKFTPTVSLLLIPFLIAPPGWSQAPESARISESNVLQVKVLESDGPQVVVGSHSSKGFSILVSDGAGTGVADAAVVVRLPDGGASGLFSDGSHSAVLYTDAAGRAHVDNIAWGINPGTMVIRVTATKGDEHAGILLDQNLVDQNSTSTSLPVAASPGGAVPASATTSRIAISQSPDKTEAALETPKTPDAAPRLESPKVVVSTTRKTDDLSPLNTIAPVAEAASVRPAIRATAPLPEVSVLHSGAPSVSISNDGSGPYYGGGFHKKKWIIIGLTILAGAGAAYAISTMSKSAGSTTAGSSSISIGAPTLSVGHP